MTGSVDVRRWLDHAATAPSDPRVRGGMLHELLAPAASGPAVTDGDGTWSRAELADRARAAAALLRELGVVRGDRVLVAAAPRRELVALIWGTSLAGAVLVPVHPAAPASRLAVIAADAGPALIVADEPVPAARQRFLPWPEFARRLRERYPTEASADEASATGEPGDAAVLFYTSGSTAAPKAVRCAHRQISFCTTAIAARLRYRDDDVVLVRLPFSFDYAFYQALLCGFAGAHLVLAAPDDLNVALLRRIRRTGTTVLPVVPQLARSLLALAERDSAPTSLRLLTNTGEHLGEPMRRALRQRFPDVSLALMYGLTECKRATAHVLAPGDPDSDAVGPPLPGCGVAICDEEGRALPAGSGGEIVVFGPNVADGYWRDAAPSGARFARCTGTGWRVLFTGDRGTLDERGLLRVDGRRDGIFKSAGVRTSTAEVEAAATAVPGVRAAAAVPDPRTGRSVLWVCGDAGGPDVLRELASRLEPAKVPAACHVVPDLPLTPNGKIDRTALAEEVS